MQKRAKKLAALLCVATLALSGCGNKQTDTTENGVATTESTVQEATAETEAAVESTTVL